MRFQTKLLYMYSLLIILLVAVLSLLFFSYISDASFKSALAALGLLDRKVLSNSYYTTEAIATIRARVIPGLNEDLAPGLIEHYRYESARAGRPSGFHRNPVTGESEYIVASTSVYTGLTVSLVLNMRILLAPLGFVRSIILAIGLLISIPPLIFFIFFNKKIVSGMVAGAVKS